MRGSQTYRQYETEAEIEKKNKQKQANNVVLQTLREGVRGSQTYRHYETEGEIERHKQASNDVLQTIRERGQTATYRLCKRDRQMR